MHFLSAVVTALAVICTVNWTKATTKLIPSDGQAVDEFGHSVAINDDLIVVGSVNSNNGIGAAYVFDQNGERAKLVPSDGSPLQHNFFGRSVAVSGDLVIVASHKGHGAVYVFDRAFDNFGQRAKLTAGMYVTQLFAVSIAIDGDSIIAGSWMHDSSCGDGCGAAYLFDRHFGGADNFGQRVELFPADGAAWDQFGNAVSIDGDLAVVGSHGSGDSGSAYVIDRSVGGPDHWGERAKLQPSPSNTYGRFGQAVAISGDLIVVGDGWADTCGEDCGAAYVFDRHFGGTDNFGQVIKLESPDGAAHKYFGRSVAVSGSVVAIGAFVESSCSPSQWCGEGLAFVFHRDFGGADNYGQVGKVDAENTGVGGAGYRLRAAAVSNGLIVVGAPGDDDCGVNCGSVHVECMLCPGAGQHLDPSTGDCILCPFGEWSAEGQCGCQPCPSDAPIGFAGAKSPEQCLPVAAVVGAGIAVCFGLVAAAGACFRCHVRRNHKKSASIILMSSSPSPFNSLSTNGGISSEKPLSFEPSAPSAYGSYPASPPPSADETATKAESGPQELAGPQPAVSDIVKGAVDGDVL